MKFPGQPKTEAPAWYNDRPRPPSHIEAKFASAVEELADFIESEHWFGDPENHGRYRVDFILKDARLIIELDGHAYHSSPEQRKKDAMRGRYLTRAGYDVIRFTGSEIVGNVQACVDEVRTIYRERLQRSPCKYRVMYVDLPFFQKEASAAVRFFNELHPGRNFKCPDLQQFLPHAIGWLHEKSFVTVFAFHSSDESESVESLEGSSIEYDQCEVKVTTLADEFYSIEMGDHMMAYSHLFDEFLLVADDPVYVAPLLEVVPSEYAKNNRGFEFIQSAKLLRRGNEATSYAGTELARVRWQNIWYVVGATLGLELHQM